MSRTSSSRCILLRMVCHARHLLLYRPLHRFYFRNRRALFDAIVTRFTMNESAKYCTGWRERVLFSFCQTRLPPSISLTAEDDRDGSKGNSYGDQIRRRTDPMRSAQSNICNYVMTGWQRWKACTHLAVTAPTATIVARAATLQMSTTVRNTVEICLFAIKRPCSEQSSKKVTPRTAQVAMSPE